MPLSKMARKTTKRASISYACRTPKILGREGKDAQNRKDFLEKEKGKEIEKGKEKKIRAGHSKQPSLAQPNLIHSVFNLRCLESRAR